MPIRRCAPGSSSVAQPNGLEENTIGFWTVLCFERRFLDDSIGLACIVLTALVLAFSLETHQAVNFQSAVVEEPQTGDNVTIGPKTYNSETLNLSIGKAAHPDAQICML